MEYKKKTIIWEDNNEPPKNYIWVKSDGNAYEFNHTLRQWEKIMSSSGSDSGEGEGGSDSMSMYDAWMKTFKNLQSETFPVTPKKAFKGWPFVHSERVDNEIELTFCNDSTDRVYIAEEEQIIYDIEQIPDDIYDTEDYTFVTFLYDLDELNQFENISNPIQQLFNNNNDFPTIGLYGNNLSKWNTNILVLNDKYYVWFQDWD